MFQICIRLYYCIGYYCTSLTVHTFFFLFRLKTFLEKNMINSVAAQDVPKEEALTNGSIENHENTRNSVVEQGIPEKEKMKISSIETNKKPCCQEVYRFTFIVMAISAMSQGFTSYMTASYRMLEKQYGLSAAQTGLLESIDNVTSLIVLLLVGYFGDKLNIARILGVCYINLGLGIILHALPYFLFKGNVVDTDFAQSGNISEIFKASDIICHLDNSTTALYSGTYGNFSGSSSTRSVFYLLIVARLVFGIGVAPRTSLPFAYINQQKGHNKGPILMGLY